MSKLYNYICGKFIKTITNSPMLRIAKPFMLFKKKWNILVL